MSDNLKYLKTYRSIKEKILSGQYPSGTMLPTEMELCALYGVGRSTLRRALAMLADDGFVKAQQGQGTTVAFSTQNYASSDPVSKRINAFHLVCTLEGPLDYTTSPLSVDTLFAPPHIAEKMGLPAGTEVFRVQRINYVNGRSYGYLVNYVNPALAPDLDKGDIGPHITEYLVRHYGIKRTRTEGRFRIIPADFAQSRFLGVEMGTPCFMHVRTGYVNDSVYDYSEHIYNPELIEIVLDSQPVAELDEIVPDGDKDVQ